MKVGNKHYRTIWMNMETGVVSMIEQNLLPFDFKILNTSSYLETCNAIKTMVIRGAGAIGSAAGFAMAQAVLSAPSDNYLPYISQAKKDIENTRPTAQNLFYATERVFDAAKISVGKALIEAQYIAEKDAEDTQSIGKYGNELIEDGFKILTHCNAGWLAFTDYGTALAPIYIANKNKKNVFVWVDETRPRSQGARLTAWELHNENIPHKIIPDNAAAFLMDKGEIDLIITGADRIAANGDTANKIGTLEKAIIAKEYNIPFYIAAPTSTFDIGCPSGKNIPIEERSDDEILYQTGLNDKGKIEKVLVCSPNSRGYNPAFDVTPAKYIKGIITEKGIIEANLEAIRSTI